MHCAHLRHASVQIHMSAVVADSQANFIRETMQLYSSQVLPRAINLTVTKTNTTALVQRNDTEYFGPVLSDAQVCMC